MTGPAGALNVFVDRVCHAVALWERGWLVPLSKNKKGLRNPSLLKDVSMTPLEILSEAPEKRLSTYEKVSRLSLFLFVFSPFFKNLNTR